MNNKVLIGTLVGVILAFAMIFGGLLGVFWVVLLGGLGGAMGAHMEGLIDLRQLWDSIRRGRRG